MKDKEQKGIILEGFGLREVRVGRFVLHKGREDRDCGGEGWTKQIGSFSSRNERRQRGWR